MSTPTTLFELLASGADDAIALTAPDRLPLTYSALRQHVRQTIAALNALGIGRDDRVAIVLPNGPEMASAFIAVAAAATAAPLNPAYQQNEYAFYMADLQTKALLVAQGSRSTAVPAAQERNIPILELVAAADDPAGRFTIHSSLPPTPAAQPGPAQPDDVALILHTSGTTSRPKIVPLLQRNVCASAANIRDTLALTPADHCLNVMPLFHIHGLMAALLASLHAGASVCCTPGFNALQFFAWLDAEKPTWYTAVPTMHQALLSRAARNQAILQAANLRFVRSSSASLPPQVMAELEATFRAPVVEAYGMTEAAHQMTSNPLPPRPRKPGSVGIPFGLDVAIMDKTGRLLPPNTPGEVVIRGRSVTPGYENNPTANAENFTAGWFRTGDQGVQDADGYLMITGRLKEIINRGGEKISPREVDEVLLDHPAVQQAVTFAMPHAKLGEEVAAAVVLRDGAAATERDIRDFAAERLAPFKVPRKLLILSEIPKGPTGKLQRIGLAEKLGLV
ncbi:MAG: AMP-binding protein [Chloroflexi bacterium]|nr:AMP-binding protein [Chloroflexota bacterium]